MEIKVFKMTFFGIMLFCFISCNYYDDFSNRIKNYQDNIELDMANNIIDSTTFDIDNYFSLYDRLVFDSSYNYFINYFYMGDAGYPTYNAIPRQSNLKIFKVKEPPFLIIADSLPSKQEWDDLHIDYGKYLIESRVNDSTYQILRVSVKDSLDKKGYFQLLIFHIEKDNFCRFGHSNYGNINLVFSQKDIEVILNMPRYGGIPFSSKQKNEALKIDYNPEVLLKSQFCYVDIVSFSDWHGFYRLHFRITTKRPHEITLMKSELLVEYDIGIMF
jgi:hypothetical protein